MDAISDSDPLAAKISAADRGELVAELAPPGHGAPPGAAMGAPPGKTQAEMMIEAALYYGDIGRAMLPERVQRHWTDERLRKVGEALARCAEHYGWTFLDVVKHPLGMLVAASFPLAWPIVEPWALPYIKAALSRKPAAPPLEEAPPAPSSDGSTAPPSPAQN